jgi:ParB family chromosome partitioning protein
MRWIAHFERDFMSIVHETQRRRLGRGLSALLGGNAPAADEIRGDEGAELRQIPIDLIDRNPFQPRKSFDAEGIEELAGSVREHGLLQPLLVRALGERYQLVAGERRLLAARKAGLSHLPCRVVDVVDKTACEFALEENLKRRDLNDIEKAIAFREYLRHFQCTIEELAKQLSMSRSALSNILRLLELPETIQNAVVAGKLSAGHARALLSLEVPDQLQLCGRIQAESLSVRQTEAAVKQLLGRGQMPVEVPSSNGNDEADIEIVNEGLPASESTVAIQEPTSATVPFEAVERSNHIRSIEEQLQRLLGCRVEIRLTGKETGTIVIPFTSNDEFERLVREFRRRDAA